MIWRGRHRPSNRCPKIKLEPVEWENLLAWDKATEEHAAEKLKSGRIANDRVPNGRMDRTELLERFDRRYSDMKWAWFGSLSFDRRDIPLWITKRSFDKWAAELTGDPQLAYRLLKVTEYRADGENLRFHVFYLCSHVTSKYVPMSQWRELVSGEADLWYSITSRGANQYLKDATLPTSTFEMKCEDGWAGVY
jgi:hypothetical protein